MQQGGSQYGVPPPEMAPFGISGTAPRHQMLGIQEPTSQQQLADAASTLSSRPAAVARTSTIDELASAVAGNYTDDVEAIAAGEEAERGLAGNRWPRQETLALLKIRSEMDAAFRDATLKGPLWDEVSRKLAEQGYTRSAKKCKEKFENVHKYYKRTKEKCGGRQDGRSYRFFSQLEALNNLTSPSTVTTTAAGSLLASPTSRVGSVMAGRAQSAPLTSIAPLSTSIMAAAADPVVGVSGGIFSFSSNTSSSGEEEDSDEEDTEEGLVGGGQRKRKRGGSYSGGGRKKMRSFFKGLMQQVLERQEVMQKRFIETIEKREQDRMIREEAWKRQEMARLNREHELMAQERAISASRDASIIAFLQKITGQSIVLPQPPVSVALVPPSPLAPQLPQQQPPVSLQQPQQKQQQEVTSPQQQRTETFRPPLSRNSSELVMTVQEQSQELGSTSGMSADPASSRWPKPEVHTLIKIRSEMEPRYQEAGPKGPLWEEISKAMQRMGYNRSSKRCKEKWENINKYFKKVKESSKKRPEDSKTCPYFHQLDELYRQKILGGGSSGGNGQSRQQEHENINLEALPITTLPPPTIHQDQGQVVHGEGGSNGGDGNGGNPDAGGPPGAMQQMNTSNGGHPPNFFEEGGTSGSSTDDMKKPEDIVKELMERSYHNMEENDNNSIDSDEDDEHHKLAYKIEFQRPPSNSNSAGSQSVATTTTSPSSFLAMVQ